MSYSTIKDFFGSFDFGDFFILISQKEIFIFLFIYLFGENVEIQNFLLYFLVSMILQTFLYFCAFTSSPSLFIPN
jgi:hypothetical protein